LPAGRHGQSFKIIGPLAKVQSVGRSWLMKCRFLVNRNLMELACALVLLGEGFCKTRRLVSRERRGVCFENEAQQ